MSLTDTFYVALCMTILILGVVYWFWTQNQYIQRKLNLLENIVFEMKTQIQKGDSPPPLLEAARTVTPMQLPSEAGSSSKYPPAPSSELGDDEDLLNEEIDEFDTDTSNSPTLKISEDAIASASQLPAAILSTEMLDGTMELHDDHDDSDLVAALQPGGVGSGIKETPEPDSSTKGNVLEGMTLKELQRLAEQKGINTTRMRKPALIEVIRAHSRPSPFDVAASAVELS